MDDLTAFIKARLDEDEARADELHNRVDCDLGRLQIFGDCSCGYRSRALRDVAAKRAILVLHHPDTDQVPDCAECSCKAALAASDCFATVAWPCATIRELAWIWSDHPDYRSDWAP